MLPEERELARLESEQAALKEQVTSAELELETAKTDTTRFQLRYYQIVGKLYVQLDELDAEIAKVRLERAPTEPGLKAREQAAKQRARRSAEEAGLVEARPKPLPNIASSLKLAYRHAIKLIHPDLATTEHERQRRTELMALVNLAYERGDQRAIEKLIEEFGQDPEAIVGEDIASRLVKAIRRIAQLRRRLGEIVQELEALQKSEIVRLKQTTEQGELAGNDPLGDLALQLTKEITQRKIELKAIGKENARSR